MERKIGEIFEYEGKKLKVVGTKGSTCYNCYFADCDCDCMNTRKILGACVSEIRTDHKPVIFVEVKEEPEEQPQEEQPELNLCEILKNCPEGTELWSDNYGKVRFLCIEKRFDEPIVTRRTDGCSSTYTKEGWYSINFPASCLLWPSKNCRDWSKFTAPWYKKEELIKPKFKVGDIIRHKVTNKDDVYEISKVYDGSYGIAGFNWMIYMKYQDQYELVPNKFDPKTLNPFDKVLGRCISNERWCCEFFSFMRDKSCGYPYVGVGSAYEYIIPYNDDTKHLVGTKDEAPEFYRYWEN